MHGCQAQHLAQAEGLWYTTTAARRRGQEAKAGVCKTPIRRFESARRLHPVHHHNDTKAGGSLPSCLRVYVVARLGTQARPSPSVRAASVQMPRREERGLHHRGARYALGFTQYARELLQGSLQIVHDLSG